MTTNGMKEIDKVLLEEYLSFVDNLPHEHPLSQYLSAQNNTHNKCIVTH